MFTSNNDDAIIGANNTDWASTYVGNTLCSWGNLEGITCHSKPRGKNLSHSNVPKFCTQVSQGHLASVSSLHA